MKQYGFSKEHRPNPIIQMGLFMDANGLPLSFTLFDGNQNEKPSMKPLEKEIIRDFKLSDFVVCIDAGFPSKQNRQYNSLGNRHFITIQSIKKLKKSLKEWALGPNGWKKPNSKQEGRKNNPNDPARFITEKHFTENGEKADKVQYVINKDQIKKEEMFDGFYGICTDLEASPLELIKINKSRWEIERCFREMKTEFQACPVYLRREERIKSHFLALLVFRLFKQKVPGYSSYELVKTLRKFALTEISPGDYIPIFQRTDLTDKIHESFGFRLDRELITQKYFKKIFNQTKI